jgi:hypothetical protein
MSRAIVNVATGPHVAGQERMMASFRPSVPSNDWCTWTDELPPGSPPHKAVPYAFKAYALDAARAAGDTSLLWLDACMIAGQRPLSDLWQKIERDGYYLCKNGFTNYEWTNNLRYAILGVTPEQNKNIQHVVAGVIGLDLRHDIARAFLDEYFRLANTDAFCGPWDGPVGVRHRHDQTAASVIAWRLGMQLSDPPEWFSYFPGTEKTCVVAKGL